MARRDTDSVLARLTPGEYVLKRKAVKKIGKSKLDRANRTGKLPKGRIPRYQSGGLVLDQQTKIDNQLADAQGARRMAAQPVGYSPARSSQGVRAAATPAAGVKKGALGAEQKAAFKSLTGFKRGGMVKKSGARKAALERRLKNVLI